jgi:hypothetical protein
MRRVTALAITTLLLSSMPAAAQDLDLAKASATAVANAALLSADPQSPAPRVAAFEYSDGYKTRAKIHRYASVATLPLFATEVALGQSIYDTPSEGKKGAHVAVGTGIIGLFGVNAVTGVWNLVEARKDPHGRKRRLVHGILMLASNAGFAITPMVAPGEHERFESSDGNRSLHRTVALTSIGIGTAGYLMMLIGGK